MEKYTPKTIQHLGRKIIIDYNKLGMSPYLFDKKVLEDNHNEIITRKGNQMYVNKKNYRAAVANMLSQ